MLRYSLLLFVSTLSNIYYIMIRHYMNSLKYIKQCSSLEILNLNFINNDFDGNPFSKLKERTCTVKVIRACFYPFLYI